MLYSKTNISSDHQVICVYEFPVEMKTELYSSQGFIFEHDF